MKDFLDYQIDYKKVKTQLMELDTLLSSKHELSEQKELSPFFKNSPDLVLLIGYLHPGISWPDKFAFEYDMFGDFSSDFTVGDSKRHTYCFIELEDAKANSIFKTVQGRATADWSPRFEHGYSQIIDWFYKLDDMERTDGFEDRFGARTIKPFGLLIIGRSQFLDPKDERRLRWREEHVVVNSQLIKCLTYDELFEELNDMLKVYPLAYAVEQETIDPTND